MKRYANTGEYAKVILRLLLLDFPGVVSGLLFWYVVLPSAWAKLEPASLIYRLAVAGLAGLSVVGAIWWALSRTRDTLRRVSDLRALEALEPSKVTEHDRALEAALACIPGAADLRRFHALADRLATEWAPDASYVGSMYVQVILPEQAQLDVSLDYSSRLRGETHTIDLPRSRHTSPGESGGGGAYSGKLAGVAHWRPAWEAVLHACATELASAAQTLVFVHVNETGDHLAFNVMTSSPGRSSRRDFALDVGVLTEAGRGEVWRAG